MDDHAGMRVRNRPGGLQANGYACLDVGIVHGAVLIDGLAIDELEREVGPAIFRDAGS